MARRNSSAALSGACIGSVAMPAKRSGCSLHQPRDLVVLDGRGGDADGGLLVIEPGLRRHREHMHVDLGRIHVGEAALDIVAAARKRPVRHAGDLDHGIVVVDTG